VLREVAGGNAADPILREAKKLRADLIVLGARRGAGLRCERATPVREVSARFPLTPTT
jgi:nucleotide-binding universal stress UspA family protein